MLRGFATDNVVIHPDVNIQSNVSFICSGTPNSMEDHKRVIENLIAVSHKVPLAISVLSNSELSLPLFDESSDINPLFHLKQTSTFSLKGCLKLTSLQ
jgi:hypothetical protein